MSLQVLVDGDIVCWRCACTCEEEATPDICLFRVDEMMERIITSVGASSFTYYLSGGANFRKTIDPQYKANRLGKPKPKWLDACREHLVTKWNAIVTDGIEADDALGIAQREDTVIASIDKDLLQIPGKHYNFVKNEFYNISPHEGLKRFWTQMLVGDVADNVFGIYGIGPKKAAKYFEGVYSEDLYELDCFYYDIVADLYNDQVRMHRNARLLWILRSKDGVWLAPTERKERDEKEASRVDTGQGQELHHLSVEGWQQEVATKIQVP